MEGIIKKLLKELMNLLKEELVEECYLKYKKIG